MSPLEAELPPLDRLQARLLPAADLVMIVMWSRPPSGTLRTTRVTRATIWLSAAVAVVTGGLALLLAGYLLRGASLLLLVPALLVVPLAAGSACLAAFGIRQHRQIAARRSGSPPR
jgi:hypothetical protein